MIKLIIVNFNQRTHLDSLIESIQDQNDWEALVVDNSGELVGQSFLNTKIILIECSIKKIKPTLDSP